MLKVLHKVKMAVGRGHMKSGAAIEVRRIHSGLGIGLEHSREAMEVTLCSMLTELAADRYRRLEL